MTGQPVLSCRHLWKVYGPGAERSDPSPDGLTDAPEAHIETLRERHQIVAVGDVIRASDTHRLAAETVADEPRRIVWVATAGAGAHGGRPDIAAWAQTRGLTPRECDIVELILTGFPTSLIAERLGLSRGTVKNHRRRIYDKLDITTERELFLIYIDAAIGPGAAGG